MLHPVRRLPRRLQPVVNVRVLVPLRRQGEQLDRAVGDGEIIARAWAAKPITPGSNAGRCSSSVRASSRSAFAATMAAATLSLRDGMLCPHCRELPPFYNRRLAAPGKRRAGSPGELPPWATRPCRRPVHTRPQKPPRWSSRPVRSTREDFVVDVTRFAVPRRQVAVSLLVDARRTASRHPTGSRVCRP